MAESEKMEALKRAYAEMILNTAKEAAARVMAADLRARRVEEDLVSTKEDAARMLVRLKQMIDAKSKEAEITLLIQQRKCDELESQLNEAEGIILDLRAELNQAKEQLDESKNQKLSTLRQNENSELHKMTLNGPCGDYELFKNSRPEFIPADVNNSCLDYWAFNQRCCNPGEHSVNFESENPTPDQTKETELYTSACKQRICATETSTAQESFPVGDKSNPSNDSSYIEIPNNIQSTSLLEENIGHAKNGAGSVVRRSFRKRKLKFWDDIITACGLRRSHQFKKRRQTVPQVSCANSSEDQLQEVNGIQTEETLDHDEFPDKELIHIKALPENTELIDALVKQDEFAANFELTSSTRIDCDIEGAIATKEKSDLSHVDDQKLYKYKFSRKWKTKSMIYPDESSLQKENGNSSSQYSGLSTESYSENKQLVQVAHQLVCLSGSSGSSERICN